MNSLKFGSTFTIFNPLYSENRYHQVVDDIEEQKRGGLMNGVTVHVNRPERDYLIITTPTDKSEDPKVLEVLAQHNQFAVYDPNRHAFRDTERILDNNDQMRSVIGTRWRSSH